VSTATAPATAGRSRRSVRDRRRARSILTLIALRWAVFAVAVALWQLAVHTLVPEDYELYFPPPTTIAKTLVDTWFSGPVTHAFLSKTAVDDLLPSLARLLGGWGVAGVIGILLGILLGRSKHALEYVDPLIQLGRSIPATALIPVFIVLLKIGTTMRLAVIVFGVIWPILLNTIDGARSVEPMQLDIARVSRLTIFERLRLIIIPAAAPKIFAGLRISLSLSIILMVTSELIGATDGVGLFLSDAKKTYMLPEMWSAIVLLGILGYVLNTTLLWIERHMLAWHRGVRQIET
jgi:ABC-type nitrate/sulfonate/bicarbonate transport system permease component